jgi:hypothetical protein
LSEPLHVNEDAPGDVFTGPDIAVNLDGTPMVVWQDGGPVPGTPDFAPILGRFLDPLGNPTAHAFTVAERGREPRIAALSNGFFVVIWESITADLSRIELSGRLYDRFAVPFGPVFKVPRRQGFSFQGGAEVAGSPHGGFVVAWERGQRRPEIVGRLFDNLGAPQGDEFLIDNRPRVTQPAVAYAPDGRFTVVWTRVGVVYGRRFNADGSPRGNAFPIAAAPHETRTHPVIAFDAEGNSVVAWNRSRQPTAAAQVFDAAGRFAGPHFWFTKNLPNFPPDIQVAFLTGGRLAAVWSGRDLPFLGGALQIVERIFELAP